MCTPANVSNADATLGIEDARGAPAHDKAMAAKFLTALDPSAGRFAFQFFGDGLDRYAEIFHGTLEQAWAKILVLNRPERRIGAFVTIGDTDFNGRREENILRARALFVDADTSEQIASCIQGIKASGATPSIVVETGRGEHFYWLCPDVPRHQFTATQKGLIEKLGTDGAIHDLPRVMRLPGTLHLKDAAQPRLVKLRSVTSTQWKFSELIAKFGTSPLCEPSATDALPPNNVVPFAIPDWVRKGPVSAFVHLPVETLSAGLEPNIQQIRSAVAAIPPTAIKTEADWMKMARALAHEAAVHKGYTDQLWDILDAASRGAPGYHQEDNRDRFHRYVREAFNRSNPITIATSFHMALDHGWDGRSSSNSTTSNYTGPSGGPEGPTGSTGQTGPNSGPTPPRAVHVSSLPLVPPKRQWLHGTDLIRGAATLLVAPCGRAKSTWLLTCALACASGRELLGSHVFGGPLRALCLSTEDGMPELALRLRAAMKHYGLTDTDVPGLYVIGADRWGLPLLQAEGNRAVIDSRGMNGLIAEIDYTKPDVVIIDPLINAWAASARTRMRRQPCSWDNSSVLRPGGTSPLRSPTMPRKVVIQRPRRVRWVPRLSSTWHALR
jgi:hypothetical protein